MTKFTLQALALTGILAVSGLPALAADMTPASPAPNAAVSNDNNAKLGTGAAVGTSTKSAADMSKSATEKKADKTAKDAKDKVHPQTAQRPASAGASASVGAGKVGADSSVNTTVQH